MRKLIFILLIVLPNFLNGQIINWEDSAKDVVDHLALQLKQLQEEAIGNLNFVAEQRLDQSNIILQNMRLAINEDLSIKANQIDDDIKTYLMSIEKIIANGIAGIDDGIVQFDLILNYNLEEFCTNLSSFICNDRVPHSISYIGNKTMAYKKNIPYKLELGGTAINNDSEVFLKIGNHPPLKANNNRGKRFFCTVEIPNRFINGVFCDTAASNVDVQIQIFEKKQVKEKKIFRDKIIETIDTILLNTNLLLLPRFPVLYEMEEIIEVDTFVYFKNCVKEIRKKINLNSDFQTFTIAFPENQKYANYSMTPYIFEKEGYQKMIFSILAGYKFGFTCKSPSITQEERKFSIDCKYYKNQFQYTGTPRKGAQLNLAVPNKVDVTLKVYYKKRIKKGKSKDISFIENTSRLNGRKKALSYGTHFSEPIDTKAQFKIRLYPFYWNKNSKYIVLTNNFRVADFEDLFRVTVMPDVNNQIRLDISKK